MNLIKRINPIESTITETPFDIFDRVFESFYNPVTTQSRKYENFPSIDFIEQDKNYEVDVSLPGLTKDDFKIELDNDRLVISGEKKYSNDRKEGDYRVIESFYGTFKRAINIPEDVDKEKIDAKLENGILKVILPKEESKISKKTIEIK